MPIPPPPIGLEGVNYPFTKRTYEHLLRSSIFLLKFHGCTQYTGPMIDSIIQSNFTLSGPTHASITWVWEYCQNRLVSPSPHTFLTEIADTPGDHPSVVGALYYLTSHKLRGILGPFNSSSGAIDYEGHYGVELKPWDATEAVRKYRERGGPGDSSPMAGIELFRRFDELVRGLIGRNRGSIIYEET